MPSIPLRRLIPILVVVPMVTTVSLIGWLAFQNEKAAVEELVFSITNEASKRAHQHLDDYLESPIHINELNHEIIKSNLLNATGREALEHYFWRQMTVFKVGYIGFGTPQGDLFAIERLDDGKLLVNEAFQQTKNKLDVYEVDNQGGRGKRTKVIDQYDFREEVWYIDALKKKEPSWSQIYQRKDEPDMFAVAANHPIYDQANKLLGVLTVDHELSQLHDFLASLSTEPTIEVFITERNGALVASSAQEAPFVQRNGKWERVQATNSQVKLTQLITRHVIEKFEGLTKIESDQQIKIEIEGKAYFIQVSSWKDDYGLDWLVFLVVPEEGFTKHIYENMRQFALIGLGIIALSALLGLMATPWITRPIKRLSQAAQTIESGDFNAASLEDLTVRKDEIGQLARVINEMANIIFNREQKLQSRLAQIQQEKDAAQKAASIMGGQAGRKRIQQLLKRSQQIRVKLFSAQQAPQASTLLRSVVYFQSLSDTELEELLNIGYQKAIVKGEIVCQEGEAGDAFYIILVGSFEVCIGEPSQFIRTQSKDEFFGELALLLGIPRTATVKALEDSLLFVIDHNGLKEVLQKYPQIADSIAYQIDQHKVELEKREETLKQTGLIGDEGSFHRDSLNWIRQRMKSLFNIQPKQPV